MNKYDQVLKMIELESRYYVVNVSSYQGMELELIQFGSVIVTMASRNYSLIEKVLTFVFYDDSDKNIVFEYTRDGRMVFQSSLMKRHIVSEILNSTQFGKIPYDIQQFIKLLRQYRNTFAHSVTYEIVELCTNYMESLYIFLNWFVSDYINEKADIDNKKKVLDKIVIAKRNFYIFATRFKSINSNALTMHNLSKIFLEPEKDEKYIKQLEDRIVELEMQVKTEAAQINEETIRILRRLDKQFPEMLSKQEVIINKLDNLTNIVYDGQKEIQNVLEDAQNNKDTEEVERIINMFSNKVISGIAENFSKQNDSDKKYELEKGKLIVAFGEKNWDKLDDNSKDFLVTGKVLYDNLVDSKKMDFSGVCLLITKAVDNELHKYLYSNFKSYLKNIYHNNLNDWPSFFKKTNCYGVKLISDNDFTLGSVLYFCCNNDRAREYDKKILLDYCMNALFIDTNDIESQLKFISDKSEKIRNDYRNPAAHIKAIDKIKAEECMGYILDTTKVLVTLMEMFK